jgi:hypothetical protein
MLEFYSQVEGRYRHLTLGTASNLIRQHDSMIENRGVCPKHRYREALDLQYCSAFAKCTCTALQPCGGT